MPAPRIAGNKHCAKMGHNAGYIKGEERFGQVLSPLYALVARTPPMRGFYDFVVSDIEAVRPRSVLDVGTGPGIVAVRLARDMHARIDAVDPSISMLRIARKNAAGLSNLRVERGSSRFIPFRKRYDIIYTSLSFHHWRRKAESLAYMSGFLGRHGEIRIYDALKARRLSLFGTHRLSMGTVYSASGSAGLAVKGIAHYGPFVRVTLARRLGKGMHPRIT